MTEPIKTLIPQGEVEIDREPLFKIGDKVKFTDWHWLLGKKIYTGKITMVGIFDTALAGGVPTTPGKPTLVYGYSIKVEQLNSILIFKGVPEFLLTPARTRKSKGVKG